MSVIDAACGLVGIIRVPVITKMKFAKEAVVGVPSTLILETKHAATAIVQAAQESGTVYDGDMPPNGRLSLRPIDISPMHLTITLEPRPSAADKIDPVKHEWVVPVRQNPPRLKIKRPWFNRIGSPATIGWKAPDDAGVVAELDDSREMHRRQGPPLTKFLHHFTKPGKVIVRLIAKDKHSYTAAIRTIRVRQPMPRIRVENKIQTGRPGQNVSFAWRIDRGVDEAFIEELFENKRRKVELIGSFTVAVARFTRELVLVARGPAGERRVYLKAIPWIGLETPNR